MAHIGNVQFDANWVTYAAGRLSQTSETAAHAISIFSYNTMGRVIKKESCIPGDCNYDVKVNATYNLAGDLTSLSNGSPTQPITLSYTYDGADRLSSMTSSWTGTNHPSTLFEANSISPASYGPAGLQYAFLGAATSGAATVVLNRIYDNRFRPIYEGDTNSAGGPLYDYCIPGPNNSNCTSSSSGYSPNGNVQQLSDSVVGNWTFQSPGYDALNRLLNGTATTGPYANTPYACWQYDAFGNRTLEAVSGTACSQSPTPTSWAHYNNKNQITATGLMPSGYLYDAAGNVLNDGVNQYLYDGENRICAVKSDTDPSDMTGYVYDAAGDRVGKGTLTTFSCNFSSGFTTNSGYVVGLNGEQLTETSGGTGWLHTHVFAGGKLLATYSGTDTLFELTDWLGTRRADVGVSGCKSTWQSLPFGNGLAPTSNSNCSDTSELHFTGKERDVESGNDYFGARYYASSMGRFMSPDWSSEPEPVPYAKLSDPQTLNLYSYGRNNPLTVTDPDGHCTKDGVQHGAIWCFFHYSDQDAIREATGFFNNNAILINGGRVDPSKMTDQQLLAAWKDVNDAWKSHGGAQSPSMALALLAPGAGLKYEPNPKHGTVARGNVSAEPTNPESTLNNSVQIKETSTARVGVDPATGEYVMFRETGTGTGVYHGYATKEFSDLPNEAKAALQKAGMVSQRGAIVGQQ